jgi:hypothetical protein
MALADHGLASPGETTGGGGAGVTGGDGTGGVTGASPSTLVHSPIVDASLAAMLDRCRSCSVVCWSV